MASIPNKVATRLAAGIKRFQPVLIAAKNRDVNESDTVIIVTDMLSDVFGYDKYSDITSEHAIKGTYCDLAIRCEDKLRFLIEVKAIGLELKDAYVKQAIDYGANQGVEWVVLTNGIHWRIYRIVFAQPIDQELVAEIDFSTLLHKSDEHLELLYLLTKEGICKCWLDDYHAQKQAINRFSLAATILSEPLLDSMRRELRRLSPGIKISVEEIEAALRKEVLKGEVVEGPKADEARKRITKMQNKLLRKTAKTEDEPVQSSTVPPSNVPTATPVQQQPQAPQS